jgi:hypothetical protein
MATSGGGTVRRVKQEARLRRSGQQHLLHATPVIAFLPDQALMPPNQGVCNARYSVIKYHYFAVNALHFQMFYWVYQSVIQLVTASFGINFGFLFFPW